MIITKSGVVSPVTLTLGFVREDGNLQALATLNNNPIDEHIDYADFLELASMVQTFLTSRSKNQQVVCTYAREDAPSRVRPVGSEKFDDQVVPLPAYGSEEHESIFVVNPDFSGRERSTAGEFIRHSAPKG